MSTTLASQHLTTSLLPADINMTIPSAAVVAENTSSCLSCRLPQHQPDQKLAAGHEEQEVDETDSSSMSSTEEEDVDVVCECDCSNEIGSELQTDDGLVADNESSPVLGVSSESSPEPTELQSPVLPASSSSSISSSSPLVQHPLRSILKPYSPNDILVKQNKSVWLCLPPPAVSPLVATNLRTGTETRRPGPAVTFTDIRVRSYDQTIGDNPSVGYGPPITLDWFFVDNAPVSVHDYEAFRPSRRSPHQMMLSCYHRRNMLAYKCGASAQEIKHVEQMVNKCKWQRSVTRTFLPAQILEEGLEKAARQLKKRLTKGKQSAAAHVK